MRANIEATINFLDGHFAVVGDGKERINVEYLNDCVQLFIDNKYDLYIAVRESRRTAHSIVWNALLMLCNEELRYDGFVATSYHIKKWFADYGVDYKEVLKESVERVEEERAKAREEWKNRKEN